MGSEYGMVVYARVTQGNMARVPKQGLNIPQYTLMFLDMSEHC